MSFLKKLFGGGSAAPKEAPKAEPVDYKGFSLVSAPMAEGGQYRLAGMIEKDGRSHRLIRADVFADLGMAHDAFARKAQLMIDQMGDSLFDEGR